MGTASRRWSTSSRPADVAALILVVVLTATGGPVWDDWTLDDRAVTAPAEVVSAAPSRAGAPISGETFSVGARPWVIYDPADPTRAPLA